MMLQLSQAKILPAKDRFHDTRDEGAGRQHQRWIGGKISCDFDSISRAGAHPTALLCRLVASKITGTGRICASRYASFVVLRNFDRTSRKREIVMRAKALEPALAVVQPNGPARLEGSGSAPTANALRDNSNPARAQ